MPETLVRRAMGTIVSPWPPSTIAVTFETETSSSCAMNVRKRAVSSTPAMPITRFFENFDTWNAVQHIASRGFDVLDGVPGIEVFEESSDRHGGRAGYRALPYVHRAGTGRFRFECNCNGAGR